MTLRALVLCFAATGAVGCGGARTANPDAGRSEVYRAGEPDFDLEAVSSVRDAQTGADVALSLPQASLIYRRDGDSYIADVRWSVQVRTTNGTPLDALSWEEAIRVPSLAATRTFEPIVRTRRLDLAPAVVRVTAVVEDLATARTARREVTLSVEDPDSAPALGGLRLAVIRDTAVVPLVSRSAVRFRGALQASAQATGIADGSLATVRVLRLRADSSVAEPPSAFTPMRSSLVSIGIDLAATDTVFADTQVLRQPAAAIQIEAPLPALPEGTFRIELGVAEGLGREPLAQVHRVLTVRRADFPALVRIGDLIGPLAYIATESELAEIRSARGAFAQRAAFDRFWGTLTADRRVAASTLRAFYERAEEANRLYSTHKPGWATDRGMISVMFGPPELVERRLDEETWVFGAGSLLPSVTFDRTASRELDGVPYDVFTLRRSPAYDRAWRAARRRWRSGVVPG